MKFIYGTDLHGDQAKYNTLLEFAVKHDIKLIHLGADILPKGSNLLEVQKNFLKNFMKDFYRKAQDNGITLLTSFGNDDLYSRKKYFREYGTLLDEKPYTFEGFEFSSYPYVCDYPFPLKTACKLDHRGWERPAVEYGLDEVLKFIPNLDLFFANRSTIEEDLNVFPGKDIVAVHMPPWALSLDVCVDGRRVGSKSVFNWIERVQPRLVLCGHIHESYRQTGIWTVAIGKTLVVQPGQLISATHFVYFDINKDKIESSLVEI